MTLSDIRCEAIDVKTDTGVCPGLAKTEQSEVFVIGPRTPASPGICSQAFAAIGPMRLLMAAMERMEWEKNDYFDITCPHGVVTYRLSRTT